MSKENTHEEAYKKALEEINEEQVKEIKMIAKTILQQMQKYKEQKEEAEEAMRLLKLDLEDLRGGKLEKIRERHEKSKKAEVYNPITIPGSWITWTTPPDIRYGTVSTSSSSGPSTSLTTSSGSYTTTAGNLFAQARELHNRLWEDLTSGTYTITTKDGSKEYYL